jgi:hypothetical protein
MPRFEASSDTRFIDQTLGKAEPGQTITYTELSDAIGRDVRKHARSSLMSALRMQLNEGRVFEAIANEGYRRLTDQEIIKTQAAKGLSRISRTARKTARKVACAEFQKLSNDDKVAHNTQLSMLGAVGQMTKPKAMIAVEKAVRDKGNELPIGDTLRLMTQ